MLPCICIMYICHNLKFLSVHLFLCLFVSASLSVHPSFVRHTFVSPVESMFAAMCECQALHPDPEDEDDSDNDFEGEEYDVEEAGKTHYSLHTLLTTHTTY